MSELCAFEAILILTLRAAIEMGMRFSYAGELHFDPRDFSYWGA